MHVIETNNLSRHFGSIKAVNGLNLKVPRGIIFGFLGPNGAGKTTTINLLLGLLEPTGGSANVFGYDVKTRSADIRSNVGVLFQESGLYERLSVFDNMKFHAKIWKLAPDHQSSRIRKLLKTFGLWDRRNDITSTLSTGLQRKLAIARTLIHQPKLIFLDEPTAGLDPIASSKLQDDIIDICSKEESTFFITTHNLHEAEKICSQVAVINEGKLLAQGSVKELQKIRSTYQIEVIGKGFDNNVISSLKSIDGVSLIKTLDTHIIIEVNPEINTSSLNKIIVNGGGLVEEFKEVRSNLEDIFLNLISGNNDN